ncbi:LacI family transcription regulator [Alkalihalobacillus alcalophilus ATCC 27647 = CGMCC 1.3604]|uniref:LacI family transcription regulator n=1 Tax=Alkalihalobacillus alcalophilus ATCC 27647 = CGMCC 1.3604 TaxID=1218173 RepID=A0A4S4JWV7_ALKAL|nr:LacI family DNA-binding transcriptional regulator [Alkalihalobacillus alcalophilus]THG89723.1 LacI family transcription regulator [Alkalihalobacillus alcalophilus ATCC 27647 = CGMCC 1.3604]
MSRKKVTMQQIANATGVSKYVVSKTLNGKPGVSEKTREKILFVAKQLGYYSEPTLTSTSEKDESKSFILVVIQNQSQNDSLYWGKIIDGINEGLNERKLGMVIVIEEQNIEGLIRLTHLTGIIGVGHLSTDVLLNLAQFQVPLLLINHEDPVIQADSIYADDLDGLTRTTNHLLGLGHKNMVYVGDLTFSKSFYERWLGFRITIERAGLGDYIQAPVDLIYNEFFEENFIEWLVNRLNEGEALPTAFVCSNDDIAQKVIRSLRQSQISVPSDCSVIGFDNIDSSSYFDPPLSTVQVLKEAIGKRAVSKLLWRVENIDYPPEKLLIKGELILRKSTGVPRGK